MNRLPAHVRMLLLEGAGVPALSPESSDHDIWEALATLARFCYGMDYHDRALMYAEVVHHLEDVGMDLGPTLEDIFFDRIMQEVAVHGTLTEREGSEVREDGGPMVSGDPANGGEPTDGRATAGQPWRRPSVSVSLDPPYNTGETPEAAESVEGDAGGRRGRDLPF